MARRYKSVRKKQVWPLLILGAGLIFVGVAAAVLLAGSNDQAEGSTGSSIMVSPIAVEYPAPELALTGLDGSAHSLADYQGQVVLVNNWATWCPPCKAEMPTLQAYYDRHQDEGFLLIAIEAGDPEKDVRQFVDDYQLTFLVWMDPEFLALSAFHNESLPSSYVIDRSGIVRYTWTGPISEEMLEKYVTPLMEE